MEESYKKKFIEFILREGVLRFGEFTLKSGRISPYFFDMSKLFSGSLLLQFGHFYAEALAGTGLQADYIFGPAYKGVPLATTLALTLAQKKENKGRKLPLLFNRKEVKDHGEGGRLIGQVSSKDQGSSKGRKRQKAATCLIVDDVLTAGTAVRECLDLLKAERLKVKGLLVALDREERAMTDESQSASAKLKKDYRCPVVGIIGLSDLIQYLESEEYDGKSQEDLERMREYRREYAAPSIPKSPKSRASTKKPKVGAKKGALSAVSSRQIPAVA